MARIVRAGINPIEEKIKQSIVGAGFTPAQTGCEYLEIAQFRMI